MNKLVDSIKEYIARNPLTGATLDAYTMAEERAGKVRDMFKAAVDEAAENYRNTTGEVDSAESERFSLKGDNRWVLDNGIMTENEFKRFYDNIGAKKRGEQYTKTKDGQYIIDFNDLLIYTDGKYNEPVINQVLRVLVDNPQNDGQTYITYFKEALKEYE